MLRTFNYTNRKKIEQELIDINIASREGATYFNASIKTADLDFPPQALVYFEVYYGPTSYRFDFGTFASIVQPNDTDISELKRMTDKVYFRLKIVDASTGLILGYADKINLADDFHKGRETIFHVNAVDLTTGEIWRLNFEANSDGIPVLEINKNVDNIRDIARSDSTFLSLVYPAALRMILDRIVRNGILSRDGANWESKWIIFIEDVLNVSSTPENLEDEDAIIQWFDDVIGAFCTKNKLYQQFVTSYSL